MRRPALLLFLLLTLVQGKIVSIATKSVVREPPYELDSLDPLTGQFTKIVDLGADEPGDATLRNDNTIVYSTLLGTETGLTTVDLSTGKIQVGRHFDELLINGVAFDKVTNQTFVTAFNMTSARNQLMEVLLPNLTLRKMAEVTGILDRNAYSSSKHILFLIVESGTPFVSYLAAVGTVGAQEGKVLSNVSVALALSTLVYDDTFGVLYAWAYDGSAQNGIVVSLDYTTGKVLKTLFHATPLSTGPACINSAGSTLYSFLRDDRASNQSVIHSLDLSSGKATQVPATHHVMTLSCQ